jgi:hypothetical protein
MRSGTRYRRSRTRSECSSRCGRLPRVESASVRRIALTLLGLVLGLAGCGGSDDRLSKDEYLTEVRKIEKQEGEAAARLYFAIVAGANLRPAQCGHLAGNFHTQLGRVFDRVGTLRPPEEIEEDQERFLEAAGETTEGVGILAGQAERGELKCGTPFVRRALEIPALRRAQGVLLELARKGYRVAGTGT